MPRFRVTAISKEIRQYTTEIEADSEAEARAIADEEDYTEWDEDIDSDPGLYPITESYIDSVEEVDDNEE